MLAAPRAVVSEFVYKQQHNTATTLGWCWCQPLQPQQHTIPCCKVIVSYEQPAVAYQLSSSAILPILVILLCDQPETHMYLPPFLPA
jgi:hypothetical protein